MAGRRSRRGGRAGFGLAALLVIAIATAAAAYFGPGLYEDYGARLLHAEHCTVDIPEGRHTLTAEQANNAAIIAGESTARGLPARAASIAIATAIQESGLRNLDYGDRDSLGLFQQRPSQGWGSEAQVQDPYYATGKFYDELVKVDGWRDMPVTEAAQAVQRSAFPNAYADHEPEARLWASALTGHSGVGAISCTLEPSEGTTAQAFADRLRLDLGDDIAEVSYDPQSRGVGVFAGDATARAAIANWAVATASTTGVLEVDACGYGWIRGEGAWVQWWPLSCVENSLAVSVEASDD